MVLVDKHERWRVVAFEQRSLSMSITIGFLMTAIGFMLLLAWGIAPVLAQEGISQEEPTPTSVEEDVSPIERSFVEKEVVPGLFPQLKEELKDTDPFFRDTKLDINLRTYYFYRDNYSQPPDQRGMGNRWSGLLQVGMVAQPLPAGCRVLPI